MGDDTWAGVEYHVAVEVISAICLFSSMALCFWAIRHLCSAGPDIRRKLFWGQLLALSCTDLISSLLHAVAYPGIPWFLWMFPDLEQATFLFFGKLLFWEICSLFDFASCILEVQIAAGFAAACSGSPRFASTLRWTLPLSFVAAAVLACVDALLHGHDGCMDSLFFLCTTDNGKFFWSAVILSCCALIVVFCGYSIAKTGAVAGPIQRRGLIRGVSYVLNAIATWGPLATVGTYSAGPEDSNWGFWWRAKAVANFLFYLNGAANVSFYVFWMWRSRKLQERMDAEGRLSDRESFVLDTYFDVAGCHDAETLEAMRLAAEAIAMVRVAEDQLEASR